MTNPSFRLAVLILGTVTTMFLSNCTSEVPSQEEVTPLRLEEGGDWAFVGVPWQESSEGIITPSEQPAEENLAFFIAQAYSDLEAEFEFRWDTHHSGVGFVFRAEDAQHYYLVHFPCTGQHYRAEHFWAAISKVDENGWAHYMQVHPDESADYIRYKPEELDHNTRWISRTEDQAGLGLAVPATCDPEGYTAEKNKGNIKEIPARTSVSFSVAAGCLEKEEAKEMEGLIDQLVK